MFDYLPFSNSFVDRMKKVEPGSGIKKRLDRDRTKIMEKAISRVIKRGSSFFLRLVDNNP